MDTLQIEAFRLELSAQRLWQGEDEVRLTAKAFAVLRHLVEHRERLVSRDDLFEAVWGTPYVSEAALASCIRELRRALGDSAQQPTFIQTVRGRGYRFVAPVTAEALPAVVPGKLSRSHLPIAMPGQAWRTEARTANLIVGREVQLRQLHQLWQQVCQGERQVVFVTGEAGIGKTALVDAFVAQMAAADALWMGRGQCMEHYGSGEAYLPLLEVLSQWGCRPEGRSLVELLRWQAPSWLLHLPALLAAPEYEQLQRRSSGTMSDRMLRELAEAVETLTQERPLVLVLEDLHWSDYATLDWLALMARRRAAARLLVLGTYRPADAVARAHPVRALTQELQRHGQGLELLLPSLSAAGVADYLAQRFAMAEFPRGFAPILHHRTNGNPFFLVTVVEELVRQGVLEQQDTGWTVRADLDAVAIGVPESVRQLIDSQLMQVSAPEQEILAAASVVGLEFAAAAVAAGVEPATEEVEACFDALARRQQFVRAHGITEWPDGTVTARYQFIHDLYREVLYDRIPASRRVRWHRQMGARLEAGYGPQARQLAAELAEHFVRGRDTARAVQYLQYAGEQAVQRSAHQEALRHLTQGLELLATLPETPERAQRELRLQTALGSALMVTRGFGHPEVERAYARARALCQQEGDAPEIFPVLSGLWRYANGRAQHQQARELGEHLLAVAEQSGDPGLLLQAHHTLWTTAYHTGALATAYQHIEHGLALYTPDQHHAQTALYGGHDPGACGRSYASKILWLLGYPEQAAQWNEAALTLARELAHPFTLGHTVLHVAGFHWLRRDAPRVSDWAQATRTLGQEQESPYLEAQGTVLLGWAQAVQGQGAEGIAMIRQGLAAWQAIGTPHLRAWMLALLAEAYGHTGRVEEGLAALAEALTIVGTTGGGKEEAELYRLNGELLVHAGYRPEEVETCLHQALTTARRQQAKSWELRVALSLSRLWQQQDKHQAAYNLLAPVYEWFTEGFDTADLQAARALLDDLEG